MVSRMMMSRGAAALILAASILPGAAVPASAHTICTIIADASAGKTLLEQGDCATRVTPASTFKVAISLMGFDSGFLKDAHTPTLPYKKGYVDWGGANWEQPTDPARWIKYSVVWFSQQVTQHLGPARFQKYADAFSYGNRDLSGDPGKHNGLLFSWIGSSLKIAPREEIAFLTRLTTRKLPVSAHAFDMTEEVTRMDPLANGWTMNGKTGSAAPKKPDGTADGYPYGWFVGWSRKDGRTFVYARLIRDDKKEELSSGLHARADLLTELPALLDRLAKN